MTTDGPLDLDAITGDRVSGTAGILSALDAVLDAFESPDLPDLPPLHAGLVGYLGYDVVREVEHLPAVPPDDLGHPDAVLAVIGQLAAFDHWRQRVVLIDNVVIDPEATEEELDRRLPGRPGAPRPAGGRLLPSRRPCRPAPAREGADPPTTSGEPCPTSSTRTPSGRPRST